MSAVASAKAGEWVDIEQPSTCKLSHKAITLENGAKIIVVHDPASTSAAAAMSIRVGSNQDPPELPGLAHLCEHMLFLGTEKYPKEGEYDSFVSQHGGSDNAWTEDGCTNYYFTISSAQVMEALDRFLHFFVSPLFTADSLEREVQAVHSEDEKNHNIDYWRKSELFKLNVFDKEHPQSQYGNGNEKTLWTDPRAKGVDVRARLLAFYKQYYVAESACLCVHSPVPAEEILAAAGPILAQMQSGPRADNTFNKMMPFDSKCLTNWYNLKAVKSMQKIRLEWMVPFSVTHYETYPPHYVSHVLGHECKGSILAHLKQLGYAEELCAGCSGRGVDDDWDSFCCEIDLTVKGCENLFDVIAVIFQGIRAIKKAGVVDAIVKEDAAAKKLSFNLADVGRPHNHASGLARSGNFYPLHRAWSGGSMLFGEDNEGILKCLDCLTPSNCVYLFRSNKLSAGEKAEGGEEKDTLTGVPDICLKPLDQVTEHHKAPFGVQSVPKELLDKWNQVLTDPEAKIPDTIHMPQTNPFLAEDLTVYKSDSEKAPKKFSTPHGNFYWRRDIGHHEKPRSCFAIELQSPVAYTSPLHRFFARVFHKLLKDDLNETMYFGELAFMKSGFLPVPDGMQVSGDGPTEKLPEMFSLLLEKIFSLVVTEEKYKVYKAKVNRDLEGSKMEQPYSLGLELSNVWTHKLRWSIPEVSGAGQEADEVTGFPQFQEFLKQWRARSWYEAFWFGNIPHSDADKDQHCEFVDRMGAKVEAILDQYKVAAVTDPKAEIPNTRVVLKIPSPTVQGAKGWLLSQPNLNPEDPNCSVQFIYQLGIKYPKQRALADCLHALFKSKFFAALRTSETMGYIVTCGVRIIEDTCQFAAIVQSASFDCAYCFSRIHAFLQVAKKQILQSQSAQEEWTNIIQSQIDIRKDVPKTVADEGGKLWGRRMNPFGYFIEDLEIVELEKLQLSDVVDLFDKFIEGGTPYVTIMHPEKAGPPAPVKAAEGSASTVSFTLGPRRTPLTGKEEVNLPGYGASMDVPAAEAAPAAVPVAGPDAEVVTLQCIPNNGTAVGPGAQEFREEFRSSMEEFTVDPNWNQKKEEE